jgi:putative membrane protein
MSIKLVNPYARFENSDLILRDELAIDRTILANERTLLAYLRSAVALIIAGLSIIHFSHEIWYQAVGLTCLPAGFITAWIGGLRYRRMSRAISVVRKKLRLQSAITTTSPEFGSNGVSNAQAHHT